MSDRQVLIHRACGGEVYDSHAALVMPGRDHEPAWRCRKCDKPVLHEASLQAVTALEMRANVRCPWCSIVLGEIALPKGTAQDAFAVCLGCAMPIAMDERGNFSRLRPADLEKLEAPALRRLLGSIVKVRCSG